MIAYKKIVFSLILLVLSSGGLWINCKTTSNESVSHGQKGNEQHRESKASKRNRINYCGKYTPSYRHKLYKLADRGTCTQELSENEKSVKFPEIKDDLLERFKKDQLVRKNVDSVSSASAEKRREITKVSEENAEALGDHISHIGGWPDVKDVGLQAANAAWIIAQHADYDLGIQEEFLEFLHEATKKGRVPMKHFAYLLDRYRIGCDKRQIFGTQASVENGEIQIKELEDSSNLQELRDRFCLRGMEEYKNQMLEMYKKGAKE